MTGIRRFLLCCLGILGIFVCNAYADDSSDAAARAATRRDTTATVARTQSTDTNDSKTVSRTSNTTTAATPNARARTGVARDNAVVRTVASRDTNTQSTVARTTSNVLQRAPTVTTTQNTPSRTTVSRTATAPIVRTQSHTTQSRTATPAVSRGKTTSISRTATVPTTVRRTADTLARSASHISRIATDAAAANAIIKRDYTTCRQVYYDCMDEFCANKNSQLKRCACSSRVNEFDGVQAQLDEIEDKLLDFNQRLLTVNMDKEDALAISQATEGEIAFQQEDNSTSKELLDEISKKLNTTFETDSFNANLAPISLSLNRDAAFDSVDSLAGASTTALNGTSLYTAALPVCREMAMEVCTESELSIVESGYQMAIEQDCNTVAKAYQTQQDLAREKIREGSALLDISRLDTYQNRNSDDLLTCKRKMLDLLTNTAVCGENLGKCLDISGQYIDPSTGEAILTPDLINLSTLITRPTGDQTWTNAPGNDRFVSYLESKRMFLESATEKCEDIADVVWDGFIDDALSQIKLAQDAKLEEIRQSCTTLTAQCLNDAAESLEEFDARALSIFGVAADKTAKEMCAEVQSACIAVLDAVDGGTDWGTGMTEIAADKTYETILQTCREVGRNCIVQSCNSIAGNFGLCDDIDTSVNRKAIINRTACWNEVLNCVADAGNDTIEQITNQLIQKGTLADDGTFYAYLYGQPTESAKMATDLIFSPCLTFTNDDQSETIEYCIYDICTNECGYSNGLYVRQNTDECRTCRLAERIWGNCETHPTAILSGNNSHNQIRTPVTSGGADDTLLSWFAKNTGTQDAIDSCRDTSCGPGYVPMWDNKAMTTICIPEDQVTDDGAVCPDTVWKFDVGGHTNCCIVGSEPGNMDAFGNCCLQNTTGSEIDGLNWNANTPYWNRKTTSKLPTPNKSHASGTVPENSGGLCLPTNAQFVAAIPYNNDVGFLFCTGKVTASDKTNEYPEGRQLDCGGKYILVTKNSHQYITPTYDEQKLPGETISMYPTSYYIQDVASGSNHCELQYETLTWETDTSTCATPTHWMTTYR